MQKRIEWLFHVMAFTLECNALVPVLNRNASATADLGTSNPASTAANALILLVTLILMLRRIGPAFRFASGMWPTLLLVLLAVLSVTWSDSPNVTLHRAASLVTVTLWAWYLVTRYDLADIVSIVGQALWLVSAASLLLAVGAPGLGRGPDGWMGVLATKNDLGGAMAIALITFFYTLLSATVSGRRSFFALAYALSGLALSAGLLYFSQSRTAWLTGAVGLAMCVLIKTTHKRPGVAVIVWSSIALLLVPGIVIAVDQLGAIATMLGKDSSLSGRIDLWLLLPSYIAQSPWLGHGFAAFWIQDSANVFQIWTTVGWEPPHAHNGWLDVLLALGIVGLIPAVLQVVLILVKGVREVVRGEVPATEYVLATTFAILIHNLTESSLLSPGIGWIMLVIASASLAKIGWQEKLQRSARPVPAARHRLALVRAGLG